mmetsp:Transcript_24314/g.30584  ORF Transcript_24314/g.30584 Transcript_24314/m.30584 type:complete len:239 (+) Transcript_24314:120-836(+)|eukprot:CAMPEP_0203663364 /NCGR_PEP_ID=MMETSP0090-20130426/965_1 /ASSEMBLY_ACC=CAM_ASM_001088 /TAXON_ID=426623 /ORGANISM="Chaetoceros affinis, Strain CCMP159" /LENGTH=238 /DNA_ID=CAMNT_0050526251 /DNA_START=49 /DNA_END=765 /DNA_ORIENTATION=-
MKHFQFLALLLIIHQSFGEEWNGCIDISSPDELVKKNLATQVCFSTGPATDWGTDVKYHRFSFKPTADEYSSFTVAESYKTFVKNGNGEDRVIFASSQKKLSFQRKYYDKNFGIFPHLTAIIDVKDGIVQGIAWDDACVFCGNDLCKENTYRFDGSPASLREPTKGCYIPISDCDAIHNNGGDKCNLKIHVVWTGTDVDGKYLTSSNKRFSLFQPKQIQDYVKDKITAWVPDFNFKFW